MTSEILVSEHGAGAVSALESARDASGSAPVTLNAALTALKSIAVALEAGLCVLEGALVVLESALATLALDTCVWAAVHKPATTGRAFVAGEGHTAVGPPVTAEVDGCPCNLLGRSADILAHKGRAIRSILLHKRETKMGTPCKSCSLQPWFSETHHLKLFAIICSRLEVETLDNLS